MKKPVMPAGYVCIASLEWFTGFQHVVPNVRNFLKRKYVLISESVFYSLYKLEGGAYVNERQKEKNIKYAYII